MSGKTETQETGQQVRLPTDLVRMANVIRSQRGGTLAEMLDPLIRPWLSKEYRKVLRELNRDVELGEAGA
jgi:hypothetical protein